MRAVSREAGFYRWRARRESFRPKQPKQQAVVSLSAFAQLFPCRSEHASDREGAARLKFSGNSCESGATTLRIERERTNDTGVSESTNLRIAGPANPLDGVLLRTGRQSRRVVVAFCFSFKRSPIHDPGASPPFSPALFLRAHLQDGPTS